MHVNVINQLEQQFGQISSILNKRQQGALSSNTIQNPKSDGHLLIITTRNGKMVADPPMPMFVENEAESVIVDNEKFF